MRCAALFARQPRPGETKTRLQSVLTAQESADLYTAFLHDTAATLAACQAERKIVAYTGEGAATGLPDLLDVHGDFEYQAQVEGPLGTRMEAMFDATFTAGSRATVLIGTDSPSMPAHLLDEALDRLRTHDIVIGPSTDGGYYLIGLSSAACGVFDDQIEWGTGRVLTQTLSAIGNRRLSLLPVWYDVDLPQEAAFLHAHLKALHLSGQEVGQHSLAALEELTLPAP